MDKPIKLIQSETTRQWHSNIIGANGRIVHTSEPVKRKAFAVTSVKSTIRTICEAFGIQVPKDIESKIQFLPAPRKKKVVDLHPGEILTSNISG